MWFGPLNVDGSRGLGFDSILEGFVKLAKIRGGQKMTPPTPKIRGGYPLFYGFSHRRGSRPGGTPVLTQNAKKTTKKGGRHQNSCGPKKGGKKLCNLRKGMEQSFVTPFLGCTEFWLTL